MSIAVPLERLRASTEKRGTLIVDVGRRSAANKAARPAVSLLYPVRTDDDYSLIVDGTAAVLG